MIFITSDPKLANSQIFVEICEGKVRPFLVSIVFITRSEHVYNEHKKYNTKI
jgi:hypothetical protein